MTRINVVPVQELCDQHLLAEHRELTRIPNMVLAGTLKVHYDDRPSQYTLGKGHVKFFTNKLQWLLIRYAELYQECRGRNFNVTWNFPHDLTKLSILGAMGYYRPTDHAAIINRARIRDRWPKQARYYGKPMEKPQ